MGQNPKAVAPVRGVDGTSWDNDRPAGVVDAFQVIQHSVEPCLANRCRNLLSQERSGPAGADEPEKVGPQVPIVILAFSLASDRERLAGRASRPEFSIVGLPSKSGCEGPPADAGEEMALPVSGEVGGLNIGNAPGVDVAWGNQPRGNQVAQPLRGVRFELVVVVHRSSRSLVRRSRGGLTVARETGSSPGQVCVANCRPVQEGMMR